MTDEYEPVDDAPHTAEDDGGILGAGAAAYERGHRRRQRVAARRERAAGEGAGEVVGAPRQLGCAAVDGLEPEQDPVAVVVVPPQVGGADLGRKHGRDGDLAAREVGGVGVLLGGDGLDEDLGPVAQPEEGGVAGGEAARGAGLAHDVRAGELGDAAAHVAGEVRPVQPRPTEG